MYGFCANEDVRYRSNRCFRRKLQEKFDSIEDDEFNDDKDIKKTENFPSMTGRGSHTNSAEICSEISRSDRKVLTNLSNLSETGERVWRTGTEKLTKTINNVRTTLGSISQKFKSSTKRRQRLEEGAMTPGPSKIDEDEEEHIATPKVRQILGRTPTKLYSPFGIETPNNRNRCYSWNEEIGRDKENIPPNHNVASQKEPKKNKKKLRKSIKMFSISKLNKYSDLPATPTSPKSCTSEKRSNENKSKKSFLKYPFKMRI